MRICGNIKCYRFFAKSKKGKKKSQKWVDNIAGGGDR